MPEAKENREPRGCWSVWIDEAARIASFHPVERSRKAEFCEHGHFMQFVSGLQQQGFRFQ